MNLQRVATVPYEDEEADPFADDDIVQFQVQLKHKVLNNPQLSRKGPASNATWQLEKRREMAEVQGALDNRKKQFEGQEEELKKRYDDVQKRDREFQDSLTKFNRFLLDNDAKRGRAERKYVEEKLQVEEKSQEVKDLLKTLEALKKEKEEKAKQLGKLAPYQQYLHTVIESTEEFRETKALAERWTTLETTSAQLQESIAWHLKENEATRLALQKYTEGKTNEVLGLNNKIARMQQQLEALEHRIWQKTSDYNEKSESFFSKSLEYGQITMACENIFKHVVDYGDLKVHKTNPIHQLHHIGLYLSHLQEVATKGQRKQ